jgi:hypothetical protein
LVRSRKKLPSLALKLKGLVAPIQAVVSVTTVQPVITVEPGAGDIVSLPLGPLRVYLLCHPADIAYILQDNYHNYTKSRFTEQVKPVLGQGLVTSDGALWRTQRRLVQPGFHASVLAQFAETIVREHPVMSGVEQDGGGFAHRRRAVRPGAKMHTEPAFIAQIQFRKCGLVAARKRGLGTALFLQPGKGEFEVLAGPQLAGGIIGARTEIATWPQASNRNAIAGFRNRIADPKFREKRLAAEVFKPKGLLAAELAAQTALPIQRRKIGGRMGARKLRFLVQLGCGTHPSALGFHRNTFRSIQ